LLEVLEMMWSVLLCMLEAVESKLGLLELLEVPEVVPKVEEVLKVMEVVLKAVEVVLKVLGGCAEGGGGAEGDKACAEGGGGAEGA
jgi:hypothetical protein